jgi:hypothetical protein
MPVHSIWNLQKTKKCEITPRCNNTSGRYDGEKREKEIGTDLTARWVKVERNKAAIGDASDGLLLIEHGTRCPALCGTHWQGAGMALLDISVPLWGDSIRILAGYGHKLG